MNKAERPLANTEIAVQKAAIRFKLETDLAVSFTLSTHFITLNISFPLTSLSMTGVMLALVDLYQYQG